MISKACGELARASPSTRTRDGESLAEICCVYLGDCANAASEDALAVEFILSSLEQVAPRGDIRTATKQSATLTLGHSAPHAELDSVVECVCQAVSAYNTT